MIIRHIAMRSLQRSSFAELVRYLLDPQDKQERVGKVSVTHCANEEIRWVIHEVESTQVQNQRAAGDKTYHMLISFPDGEHPTETILTAIETRICKALGFESHQRISVIHYDTDNTHVHVAINKIHPQKLTLHEPYLAYKTMAKVAIEIEAEYGLQKTNHEPHQMDSQTKVKDMEHRAGIESLISWIKRECLEPLTTAQTWTQFHQVLQQHQLEIRDRGNGLIIIDAQGIAVKASSVSRNLSKGKLEERFGAFQEASSTAKTKATKSQKPGIGKVGQKPPKFRRYRFETLNDVDSIRLDSGKHYTKEPLSRTLDELALYAQYRIECEKIEKNSSFEFTKICANRILSIDKAIKTSQFKRAAVKFFKNSHTNKKLLYALIHRQMKAEIDKANQQYREAIKTIRPNNKRLVWFDWLVQKAQEGDVQAMKTLRIPHDKKKCDGNGFGGNIQDDAIFLKDTWDSITKQGTVIYHLHNTSIRDNGQSIFLPHETTPEGIAEGLKMAQQRFGQNIEVHGSLIFKKQVVEACVSANLSIVFADAILENLRKKLIQQQSLEKNNERRNIRSHARRSTGSIRTSGRSRGGIQYQQRSGRINKPNLGRIGAKPPPNAQNRLRSLSELGMVQLTSRGEMLLPSHVPHHVEHQRTQSNDKLRRDVSGARLKKTIKSAKRRS